MTIEYVKKKARVRTREKNVNLSLGIFFFLVFFENQIFREIQRLSSTQFYARGTFR